MQKSNKGFTVLELLIVILILAVLAGITFPVVQNARRNAYQTKCASNLRQLGQAVRMYMSDHDNEAFLPPRLEPLDAYSKSPQLLVCDLDFTSSGYAHAIFGCERPYNKRISYGYAGSLSVTDPDLDLSKRSDIAFFCDTLHGLDRPDKGWATSQEFAVDGSFASPPQWLPIYEGKCLRVMQDGHIATGSFHVYRYPSGQETGWSLISALTHEP